MYNTIYYVKSGGKRARDSVGLSQCYTLYSQCTCHKQKHTCTVGNWAIRPNCKQNWCFPNFTSSDLHPSIQCTKFIAAYQLGKNQTTGWSRKVPKAAEAVHFVSRSLLLQLEGPDDGDRFHFLRKNQEHLKIDLHKTHEQRRRQSDIPDNFTPAMCSQSVSCVVVDCLPMSLLLHNFHNS